jgi:hypothetical protein
MLTPFRSPRPTRWTRAWLPLTLLTTILLLLTSASLAAAASSAVDRPLAPAETLTLYGGTCSTCGSSGGSDTGSDSGSDDPSPRGSSYWVTTDQVLSSLDRGVADIVHQHNNWDDQPLIHTYEIERRVSRSVGFSGGYADHFRASIGGEIDRTTRHRMQKTLDPWEGLKVYRRQETRRYTVYGTRYQDYDDGSRKVVARASGPYTTSHSVFGFVTYALR